MPDLLTERIARRALIAIALAGLVVGALAWANGNSEFAIRPANDHHNNANRRRDDSSPARIQQHSRMRRARSGMGNVATGLAAWLSTNMGMSKGRMTEGQHQSGLFL